jgi:hypothetical protein
MAMDVERIAGTPFRWVHRLVAGQDEVFMQVTYPLVSN